jgi:hypothetical protein
LPCSSLSGYSLVHGFISIGTGVYFRNVQRLNLTQHNWQLPSCPYNESVHGTQQIFDVLFHTRAAQQPSPLSYMHRFVQVRSSKGGAEDDHKMPVSRSDTRSPDQRCRNRSCFFSQFAKHLRRAFPHPTWIGGV